MIKSLRSTLTRTATIAGAAGVLALGAAVGAADASGSGTRTASSRATVPPIHETFTEQACPANASTTLALEHCAGDRVLAADQKIDSLDTAVMKLLPAAGQAQFVSAARQWLSYRNMVAQAAASPDSGGTIVPVVILGAMQTEDQAHISALTAEFTSESGQKP